MHTTDHERIAALAANIHRFLDFKYFGIGFWQSQKQLFLSPRQQVSRSDLF